MNERTWALVSTGLPEEGGYYQARYYNEERGEWLYKALFFNPEIGKWIGPWSWSFDRTGPFPLPGETEITYSEPTAMEPQGIPRQCWRIEHKGITVEKYDPNSRTDFYGQQF